MSTLGSSQPPLPIPNLHAYTPPLKPPDAVARAASIIQKGFAVDGFKLKGQQNKTKKAQFLHAAEALKGTS